MERAVRRLDAALGQRTLAMRSLAEQHGLAAAELKTLREEMQAARDEAAGLRERAALVDALRAELAQYQAHEQAVPAAAPPAPEGQAPETAALAARDSEIAALKDARDDLQMRLDAALSAQAELRRLALQAAPAASGEAAALQAELTAARAAQAEMQAFQTGIAARLEATMARLRMALDDDARR